MHVRLQPARIVERSGLNQHHTGAPLGFVIDPRTASRAEGAELGSTRSGFRCERFQFALGEPKVRFIDDQVHAKGAAGLALAIGAMTDNELMWCSHHFITNVAALTASCIFGSHNFNPPGGVGADRHESLFLVPAIIRPKGSSAVIKLSFLGATERLLSAHKRTFVN